MNDEDALTAALIENLQREDLNPLEEAQAIQSLRERLPLSQEELAQRLGKSRSAVANALRLLQLPEPMREALREGTFTPGHARAVLALPERALQDLLFRAVMERHLSVRDAEAAVLYWRKHGMLPTSISAGPARKNGRTAKPETIRQASCSCEPLWLPRPPSPAVSAWAGLPFLTSPRNSLRICFVVLDLSLPKVRKSVASVPEERHDFRPWPS